MQEEAHQGSRGKDTNAAGKLGRGTTGQTSVGGGAVELVAESLEMTESEDRRSSLIEEEGLVGR